MTGREHGVSMVGRISAGESRPKFTERERQVLSFVFEGLANRQIADRVVRQNPSRQKINNLATRVSPAVLV